MKNREELVNILQKKFLKFDECFAIFTTEIINEGKMTSSFIQNIMSSPNRLEATADVVLLWLYKALKKYDNRLPELNRFFTEQEKQEAELTITKKVNSKFPITFHILSKLTDNDNYLICLSVQEIAALKEAGIIHWVSGMQRETVITKVAENSFVSHIKFDDNRAREIGDSMSKGEFYPSAMRWHIVSGSSDYDVTADTVILKSGYIAEIDGQHRDKGSEYALQDNPDIIMNMPIILTIGKPTLAQHIINQDEERAPINKDVVALYKSTSGNSILKAVMSSEKLDPVYKFCDTVQGVQTGSGFVLKSTVTDAIEEFYCKKRLSRNAEEKIADWLVDFLNQLADEMCDDFNNFRENKKKNQKAYYTTFKAYVYISKVLQGRDKWKNELSCVLAKMNFGKDNSALNTVKYLNAVLKGVGIDG